LSPDSVAALVRAFALAALFQAVGGAIYLACFGEELGRAVRPVRRLARGAAIAGILLIAAHGCLETARLSGEFAGAWDRELQELYWTSRGGRVHALQMAAMAMIAACVAGGTRLSRSGRVIGSIAATAAFAATGHTSIHPLRAILAPMLIIHVSVGACWFGSLGSLLIMMRLETTSCSTAILQRFSQIAGYTVPLLGVVGAVTAIVLVSRPADFARPYGLLLIAKVLLFIALLVLASFNRWRYLPAMEAGSSTSAGSSTAVSALRRSIGWEIALIMTVLAATSIMTTYFSPES
jgi:putative copper resistance protein D